MVLLSFQTFCELSLYYKSSTGLYKSRHVIVHDQELAQSQVYTMCKSTPKGKCSVILWYAQPPCFILQFFGHRENGGAQFSNWYTLNIFITNGIILPVKLLTAPLLVHLKSGTHLGLNLNYFHSN